MARSESEIEAIIHQSTGRQPSVSKAQSPSVLSLIPLTSTVSLKEMKNSFIVFSSLSDSK